MHIYFVHDILMVLAGGICGAAVTVAIEDVKRTIHTSEKDRALSLGDEAEKYATGMLKLMKKRRNDLLRLKSQWKQPIR